MPETSTFTFDTKLGDYVFEFSNPATLNRFWGEIASLLGQNGVMGEHSSSHGVFTPDPGEGGRTGVGNLSKDNPNFQPPDDFVLSESSLSAGSQGLHALFQAARLGDPALPDGSAEESVGPFIVESTPTVTVTFIPDFVI